MCIPTIHQTIGAPLALSNQLSQWFNDTSKWSVNGKIHYVWLIPANFLLNVANCLLAPIVALVSLVAGTILFYINCFINCDLLLTWLFSVSFFCIVDMLISSLARIVFPCCQEFRWTRENCQTLDLRFHCAVWLGNIEGVNECLALGANVNFVDEHGDTPLSAAIKTGNPIIAELLFEHGACMQEDNRGEASPVSILKAKRMADRKTLKELIERYNTDAHRAFNYAKQYNQFKLITHAFELEGLITLQDYQLKAEGSAHEIAAAKVSKSLETFSEEFPELLDLQSSQQLAQGLLLAADHRSLTADTYLDRIKSGEPTFILTGFTGHSVTVLIWHNLFVICNRQGGATLPLKIGRINNSKLDPSSIQALLNLSDQNEETYNTAMNDAKEDSLLHNLEFIRSPDETLLELWANIQAQIAPNCSWASVEGILKISLLLSKLEKPSFRLSKSVLDQVALSNSTDLAFQTWLLFQKTILIGNYIQNGLDPTQILPDVFDRLRTDLLALPESIQIKMEGRVNAVIAAFQQRTLVASSF